jgi:transcriptional regulator with GAF, ATPase, and Fis domain
MKQATPVDALGALERITLQMTSTLDLAEVLDAVARGLVDELGAALARVWLLEPGAVCPSCAHHPGAAPQARDLHLRASAGLSTRLDGEHHRVPVGARKIGQIAANGAPLFSSALESDPRIVDKAWAHREKLASFAGYPLIFRGELLGVLALFSRRALSPADVARLGLFAARAAIAIANARLYAELDLLRGRLQSENAYLKEELGHDPRSPSILGESPALRAALDALARVAPTSSTVLLLGETGTGKELFARALHAASGRRDRPMIKLSCAAITPSLAESELFGHEKGAFTGALQRRIGRFELAHQGTLFLDEIGELPLDLQAKLLRVLEERELSRVGSAESIPVDVRLLAATNRDLAAEVQAGRFRADLYYRLNVFPLTVPPLRERRSDIPLLAEAFVQRQQAALGKRLGGLAPEAMAELVAHDWPGNVRELHNVIERAAILARSERITREDLPPLRASTPIAPPAPRSGNTELAPTAAPRIDAATTPRSTAAEEAPTLTLEAVERAHLLRVLQSTAWTIEGPTGAAALLGLRPSTLRSRLAKLGIQRAPTKP